MSGLPELPKVELEVTRERVAHRDGFLHVRRLDVVVVHEGKAPSAPLAYDVLDRRALDACVIVAHHRAPDGRTHVWVRTCLRPPLALRTTEPTSSGVLWEVAAGLIEPGESAVEAGARELAEELGFAVSASSLVPLGSWTAPAPAFIGEVHHFFHVEVDEAARTEPTGDGSPLEEDAAIIHLPLEDALAACRDGIVRDAKTELALRRLADLAAPGGRAHA